MNIALKSNKIKISVSRKIFVIFNVILLVGLAIVCILPFINLFAVSISSKSAVLAGKVWLFPVDFTISSYRYLLKQSDFFDAFAFSLQRVALGTSLSLVVTILMAYPLAFASQKLFGRKIFLALILASMFFSGGLIPTFIVVSKLGLYNTVWALVLPGAMNCWNMILVINFFRRVPKDLIEYAKISGAGHFKILLSIVIPVSLPIIFTIALFSIIGHWNAWFDGYLYMSKEKWPLQTYIYNIMESIKTLQHNSDKLTPEEFRLLAESNNITLRAAQVFIAIVPILFVYPFAQRFFTKGILLGAVKE